MKTAVTIASLFVVACSGSASSPLPSPPGASSTETSKTEATSADEPSTAAPGPAPSPAPSPSPSPTAPTTPSAPDCQAYGAAFCANANACGHLVAKVFGAACEARMAAICAAHVASPGSGYASAALGACTKAYGTPACAQEPAACDFVGTLAVGAACAFGDQCATGACSATSGACGTCVLPVKSGPTANVAGLGETCDDAAKSAPACNGQLGLTCDSKTKSCVEIPAVAIGEPCGWFGMIVMCSSGGTCKPTTTGSGVCVAEKAVGESCTGASGYNECAFGTGCYGGKCAYPTAAAICP